MLVGENSLEAKVGHLAALTGGQIFVVAGAELGEAIATALATLRIGFQAAEPIVGELRSIRATRGNAVVTAEWCYGSATCVDPELGRAIAAVAADLALPALSTEAGTGLAIAEGLVTHLTSLVLVDEEGEIQDGIPITRKIALPMPSMAYACLRPEAAYESPHRLQRTINQGIASPSGAESGDGSARGARPAALRSLGKTSVPYAETDELGVAAGSLRAFSNRRPINWDSSVNQLLKGDLSSLEPDLESAIERAATDPKVAALAMRLNLSPIVMIIALLARTDAKKNRSAARLARSVFHDLTDSEIDEIAHAIRSV